MLKILPWLPVAAGLQGKEDNSRGKGGEHRTPCSLSSLVSHIA